MGRGECRLAGPNSKPADPCPQPLPGALWVSDILVSGRADRLGQPWASGPLAPAYLLTFTTAGCPSEFQQASKSLTSGSPSVTTKR